MGLFLTARAGRPHPLKNILVGIQLVPRYSSTVLLLVNQGFYNNLEEYFSFVLGNKSASSTTTWVVVYLGTTVPGTCYRGACAYPTHTATRARTAVTHHTRKQSRFRGAPTVLLRMSHLRPAPCCRAPSWQTFPHGAVWLLHSRRQPVLGPTRFRISVPSIAQSSEQPSGRGSV